MHTVAITLVLATGGIFDGGLGHSGGCDDCAAAPACGCDWAPVCDTQPPSAPPVRCPAPATCDTKPSACEAQPVGCDASPGDGNGACRGGGLISGRLFGGGGVAFAGGGGLGGVGSRLRQVGHFTGQQRIREMPQTCYNPHYGCYPGENRHMHRYPAFHGTYYRRPYNYRNLYDYPWHAELHEPTSLFSYHVAGEEEVPPGEMVEDAPESPSDLPAPRGGVLPPSASRKAAPSGERSVISRPDRLQPIPVDFSRRASQSRSSRR